MKLNASSKPSDYLEKTFQRALNSAVEADSGQAYQLSASIVSEIEDILTAHNEAVIMFNRYNGSIQVSVKLNKNGKWENASASDMLKLLIETQEFS